jgi:hypothetical protein
VGIFPHLFTGSGNLSSLIHREWESFLTYSQGVGPFLPLFIGSGNLSPLIHREYMGPFLHLFIGGSEKLSSLFYSEWNLFFTY